jgi:hypothetical protein
MLSLLFTSPVLVVPLAVISIVMLRFSVSIDPLSVSDIYHHAYWVLCHLIGFLA